MTAMKAMKAMKARKAMKTAPMKKLKTSTRKWTAKCERAVAEHKMEMEAAEAVYFFRAVRMVRVVRVISKLHL